MRIPAQGHRRILEVPARGLVRAHAFGTGVIYVYKRECKLNEDRGSAGLKKCQGRSRMGMGISTFFWP